MDCFRVLVIGGYGFFGRRLVERLAREPGLHVIVAGRSVTRGQAMVEGLRGVARSTLSNAVLDADAPDFAEGLKAQAAHVVVYASGPFQGQRYHVARACLRAGTDYIDLADGREFVAGIACLHAEATAAGRAIVSGASSVPALSSAAADRLAEGLVRVDSVDIGISPGNRTERGLSTVRAVLSYSGKALPGDRFRPTFGWVGSRRYRYPPPVGTRLLSPCDVPDLTLLPDRYVGRPSVRFGAGLELTVLHRSMNAMAMLARLGIVRDWSVHAVLLKRIADWFKSKGSDAGAMHVSVVGETAEGVRHSRTWHLLATAGDGPFVPTLAAAALVRKLRRGTSSLVGARPCVGLLTLEDFAREAEGLHLDMGEASA